MGDCIRAGIDLISARCIAANNIRPNFGDYIGSAGGGDRVFPTWADGRNGVPDVFFANILGAGKSD